MCVYIYIYMCIYVVDHANEIMVQNFHHTHCTIYLFLLLYFKRISVVTYRSNFVTRSPAMKLGPVSIEFDIILRPL